VNNEFLPHINFFIFLEERYKSFYGAGLSFVGSYPDETCSKMVVLFWPPELAGRWL